MKRFRSGLGRLLASAAIDGARLWTKDRRLRALATELDLAASHD